MTSPGTVTWLVTDLTETRRLWHEHGAAVAAASAESGDGHHLQLPLDHTLWLVDASADCPDSREERTIMSDQDIADLRKSLQDTTSVLASLLAILIKGGPLREPEQQKMLCDLHNQAVDAGDHVRQCLLRPAFQ